MDMLSVYVGWFLQGDEAFVEEQSGADAFLIYQRTELDPNAKRMNYKTTSVSDLLQLPKGTSIESVLRAHLAAYQSATQNPVPAKAVMLDQRFLVQPLSKSFRNPFTDKITIGRAANNDVVIKLPSISKFHAWLTKNEEGYAIFDAQSTFGTFVEGAKAPQDGQRGLPVPPGTKLKLGELELFFFDTKTLGAWLRQIGVLV